jgi:hypothetical protein
LAVSVEFLPKIDHKEERKFYLDGLSYGFGYSPHFRVIGDGEYLGIQFIEGPDRPVEQGELVDAKVCLMYYPNVSYDKLTIGQEFEIFEGPNIVGRGWVKGAISFEECL